MTMKFFWTRTASVWIAILYMLMGFPLLMFPDVSGLVFVWTLAAGAAVSAVSHFFRYLQARKTEQPSGGDLFLTVISLTFSVFSVFRPEAVLSFLPLVLGSLLLIDGIGKAPLIITAVRTRSSALIPLFLSSFIPMALGILLIVNPFDASRLVIMIFGAALVIDGISDLSTALMLHNDTPTAEHEPGPQEQN